MPADRRCGSRKVQADSWFGENVVTGRQAAFPGKENPVGICIYLITYYWPDLRVAFFDIENNVGIFQVEGCLLQHALAEYQANGLLK